MDWLLILGVLAFGGLIIGWMGYTTITDSLIKDQKREIAKLRSENRRLKAALNKVEYLKSLKKIRCAVTRQDLREPLVTIHNIDDPFQEW